MTCHPIIYFRGDTASILSVFCGTQFGWWINYQSGFHLNANPLVPPFDLSWPTNGNLGLIAMRTILGLGIVALTEYIAKIASFATLCALFRKNRKDIELSEESFENKEKTVIDLCCKFFTYGMIGFETSFLIPKIFEYFNIQRSEFYSEIY